MIAPKRLSVLVPNFNHGHHLRESLSAILEQSYVPHEIIVADDCSTDDSRIVVQEIARQTGRVRLIANELNLGAVGNANRLLEAATGDYVYFASADDKVLPGLLEKSMGILERFPDAGLCSSLVRLMDELGHERELYPSRIVAGKPAYLSPAECLSMLRRRGNWIAGATLFMNRRAVIEAGGFVKDLGPFIDGFTQQVVALRAGACFIPEAMVCWRVAKSGYSTTEGRSPERYLEYAARTVQLMRTGYGDLFPPDYVASYERECLYGAVGKAREALEDKLTAYVHHLDAGLSSSNSLDRALIRTLRSNVRLQVRLIQAYVFARRQRLTWEVLRRRTKWLFEKSAVHLRRRRVKQTPITRG